MSEPTSSEASKEVEEPHIEPDINVFLVDKKHVTMLAIFIIGITALSLFFQSYHEQQFENLAIQRCHQRLKLEATVRRVTKRLEESDERNMASDYPKWIHERHKILSDYANERMALGQEQCQEK